MRAAKIDKNQTEIVKALRAIPGVTVAVGFDDILVGHKGKSYWYEVKADATAKKRKGKTGDDQRRFEMEWQGHYKIVCSLDEIFMDMGLI